MKRTLRIDLSNQETALTSVSCLLDSVSCILCPDSCIPNIHAALFGSSSSGFDVMPHAQSVRVIAALKSGFLSKKVAFFPLLAMLSLQAVSCGLHGSISATILNYKRNLLRTLSAPNFA